MIRSGAWRIEYTVNLNEHDDEYQEDEVTLFALSDTHANGRAIAHIQNTYPNNIGIRIDEVEYVGD